MKKRLASVGTGVAALACAASAWASDYSDAVLSLNPSMYVRLEESSGPGVDSSAGGLHPLRNVEGNVIRGAAGPGAADGFNGFGAGNLAYGFPHNVPTGDSAGAQTSTLDPTVPQPGDGYIPATGASARTVVTWFKLTQRPGIESDPANDPNSRQAPIGFVQYGRSVSGNTLGKEFRMGATVETNAGVRTGRDLFNLNLGARSIWGTTTPVEQDTWYMGAIVFPEGLATAADIRMFVNGTLQTLQGDLGVVPDTASGFMPVSFRIGRDFGGYGVGGTLDEVAVWERALTDGEIQNLYNAALGIAGPATWNVDADGTWTAPANWLGPVPNSVGGVANFAGAITQPRTVTLDAAQTIGELKFDNANRYTIAGTSTLTINKSTGNGAISVTSGSHTVAAPVALAVSTDVDVAQAGDTITLAGGVTGAAGAALTKTGAGTLEAGHVRAESLSIETGMVKILPNGTAAGTSNVGELSLFFGATLDVSNNKLVTETPVGTANASGTYNGVHGDVQRAYNSGKWDLPGLMTSMPEAGPTIGTTTIGVASAQQILFIAPTATGTFAGQPVTGATTIAMYTYAGDLTFDGRVDAQDYGIIDNWVQFPGTSGYANGDINYDGVIDAVDYGIIDNTIQLQGAPIPVGGEAFAGVAAVPEPASLAALCASLLAVAGRRRRAR
jgi:hypothetical protein